MSKVQNPSSAKKPASKGRNPTGYLYISFIQENNPFSFYKSSVNPANEPDCNRISNLIGLLGKLSQDILTNLFDIPPLNTSELKAIVPPNNSIFSASVEYIPNQPTLFIYSTLSEAILSSGLSSSDLCQSFASKVSNQQSNDNDDQKESFLYRAIQEDEQTKLFVKNFFQAHANIIIYFIQGYDLKAMTDINFLKSNLKPNTQIIVIHLFENIDEYSLEYQNFEQTKTFQKMYFTYSLDDYIENTNDYKDIYNTYFIEYSSKSNDQVVHLFYLDEFKDILKLFLQHRIVYSSMPKDFELVKMFENFVNEGPFFSKYGCPNACVKIESTQRKRGDVYNGETGQLLIMNVNDLKLTSSSSLYTNAFQLKVKGPQLTKDSVIIEFEYPLVEKNANIIDIIKAKKKSGRENRIHVENLILEQTNYVIKINGYKKMIQDSYDINDNKTQRTTIEQGEFFSHVDVPYVMDNELVILLNEPTIEPIKMKNKENEDIVISYSGILKVTFPRVKLDETVMKIN